MSTSSIFEQAQSAGTASIVLPLEQAKLSALPADTAARLQSDLKAGWVAIAPQRPVDVGGQPRFAWWSTDLASGETIAVTDTGRHQNFVEAVAFRVIVGTRIVLVAFSDGTVKAFIFATDRGLGRAIT